MDITPRRPVLVVGGGPVGSATALMLSRKGIPVVLVDRGKSAEKICGEGILPAGWEVMEELGLAPLVTRRGPIEGIRYQITGKENGMRCLDAQLTRPAFGVQRPHLVEAFNTALEDSDVTVVREERVRDFRFAAHSIEVDTSAGQFKCALLIGADGLHSLVRRKSGLTSRKSARYQRWGTRCYFRSERSFPRVEVTLGEGVESYLTPLGGDLHGLAFIWSPDRLGRPLPGDGETFRRLLRFLPERLSEGVTELFGADRAIGPLQQLVSSPLHPSGRVALVGDAAGYFDALTGEGLCLGLRQARCLARAVAEGTLWSYPAQHRAIKFRHQMIVSGLLGLIHQPWLRNRVFSALTAAPGQFQAVIGFAVEEAGWRTLVCSHTGRFLWGLCGQEVAASTR